MSGAANLGQCQMVLCQVWSKTTSKIVHFVKRADSHAKASWMSTAAALFNSGRIKSAAGIGCSTAAEATLLCLPPLLRSRAAADKDGGASQGFDEASGMDSAAKGTPLFSNTLSCCCCRCLLEVPLLEPAALSSACDRLLVAATALAAEDRDARVAALPERVRSTADAETTVTAPDDVSDVAPPREAWSVCMPWPP